MRHGCFQFAFFLALLATRHSVRADTPAVDARTAAALSERNETAQQRDARMAWWREARFGLFVHWGLYSVPAGVWNGKEIGNCGEWIMYFAKIPVMQYQAFAPQFNPVKYDAEKWVLAAKDAGVKYIVITAKHHEGFAMFKTAVDKYNIVDATPYKHDPLRDLVAACRKHGLKIGFYYSQDLDWHHPGGGTVGNHWDTVQDGDPDKYVDNVVIPQLREILTNYGKIDILWFDCPGGVINKERAGRIEKTVLELQPNIIINNRLVQGYEGDTETPEQEIPAGGFPGRDWETCMTMNKTWGFKNSDHDWKSSTTLIRQLAMCSSMGGNFLLNVGPTSLGNIPDPSLDRLSQIGQWMKVNGQAVYGTSASPFPKALKWGRVTRKDNMLYLMVFDLPKDRALMLPGLKTPVKRAWMLADAGKTPLATTTSVNSVVVNVPVEAALNPSATVIAIELAGKPEIDPTGAVLQPKPDGTLDLQATDADIEGSAAKLEVDHVGYWTNASDAVKWKCLVPKAGHYAVTITYACTVDSAGSTCNLTAEKAALKFEIKSTGGWDNFTTEKIGTIAITQSGSVSFRVGAIKMPGPAVMNLRSIVLSPL